MLQLRTLFVAIVWWAHLMACVWFGLGVGRPSDTGVRWANFMALTAEGHFLETGFLYQYTAALQRAAAHISLGEADSCAKNSTGRIFTVLSMMAGFLFGSTVVSSLPAAMLDYLMMRKEATTKLRDLRSYLGYHQAQPGLALPVQKQAHERLGCRARLTEKEVQVLDILSLSLRMDLRFAIQSPHLAAHPLLRFVLNLDQFLIRGLCWKAVESRVLRAKDDPFGAAAVAGRTSVLTNGTMEYTQDPSSSAVHVEEKTEAGQGQWICDAALRCEWTHVGRMEAVHASELLEVRVEECVQELFKAPALQRVGSVYCEQFHRRLMAAQPPLAPYPTDRQVPLTNFFWLVCRCPGAPRRSSSTSRSLMCQIKGV